MDPFKLADNTSLKTEFFNLAGRILVFILNWQDSNINPNMIRAYSRIHSAQEALNEYRESIKQQLINNGIIYQTVLARDTQQNQSINTKYGPASIQCIKSLNKDLKESLELVFFSSRVHKCIINDSHSRYSQLQLAFVLETLSQDKVDIFDSIPLLIIPAGIHSISFDCHSLPTKDEMTNLEWIKVLISCAPTNCTCKRQSLS